MEATVAAAPAGGSAEGKRKALPQAAGAAPAWDSVLGGASRGGSSSGGPVGSGGGRPGGSGAGAQVSSRASSSFQSSGAPNGGCVEDAIALDESQEIQPILDDDEPMCHASEGGEGCEGVDGGDDGEDGGGDYLAWMLRRRGQQVRQHGMAASSGAASAGRSGKDSDTGSPVAAQACSAVGWRGASSPIQLSDEEEEAIRAEAERGEMEEEDDDEEMNQEEMDEEEEEEQEEMVAGLGGNTQQYFSTQAYTQPESGGLSEGEGVDLDDEEAGVPYVAPDTSLYLRVASLVRPAAWPQILKLDDGPNALRLGRMCGRDPRGRFEKQLLDCQPPSADGAAKTSFHNYMRELLDVRYVDRKRARCAVQVDLAQRRPPGRLAAGGDRPRMGAVERGGEAHRVGASRA